MEWTWRQSPRTHKIHLPPTKPREVRWMNCVSILPKGEELGLLDKGARGECCHALQLMSVRSQTSVWPLYFVGRLHEMMKSVTVTVESVNLSYKRQSFSCVCRNLHFLSIWNMSQSCMPKKQVLGKIINSPTDKVSSFRPLLLFFLLKIYLKSFYIINYREWPALLRRK